jgi:hypothetical protein
LNTIYHGLLQALFDGIHIQFPKKLRELSDIDQPLSRIVKLLEGQRWNLMKK